MGQQKIQAVLFDLGETLFTFGKVDVNALFKDGAKLTYEYMKQSNQHLPGFTRYLAENLFFIRMRYLWSDITGVDFDSLQLLKGIGERMGIKLNDQQWDEVAWLWYKPLSERAVVEPDIRESLSRLRDMGLTLGIVSNTFLHQTTLDRHLRDLGILDFFTLRMYSYETAWRKPNVKIFLEAAKRINTAPQHILFVGDRLDNDVKGATKAGMIPVLKSAYTNIKKKTPADIYKIDRIAELPELVNTL